MPLANSSAGCWNIGGFSSRTVQRMPGLLGPVSNFSTAASNSSAFPLGCAAATSGTAAVGATAPTPFKTKLLNVGGSEEQPEEGTLRESDPDDDDPEDSTSLAAIETELKPEVLGPSTRSPIPSNASADLQDQDIHKKLPNELPIAGAGAQVQEARSIEHDSPLKSLRLGRKPLAVGTNRCRDGNPQQGTAFSCCGVG